jgi:putative oxidoreductase
VPLVVGLLMAAHGARKFFGWFGSHGLQATGQLGFRPGRIFATAVALGESTERPGTATVGAPSI